eukprot:c1821_g1_i1.p1 GENE.c1821_g1_i1~~c1821_g1_i1.p1  ORF type:complete len:347 (-),score=54.85 c1821_g1_i1:32-1072(-)
MVCCGTQDKEGRDRDREVNGFLKNARTQEKKKIKLLLLGAGESGKSTIFKQMKILYGTPPTQEDRLQYTGVVFANVIATMKLLIKQAATFEIEIGDKAALQTISDLSDTVSVLHPSRAALKSLWNDPGIQQVWERRTEFQVVDSIKYFFDNIDRVAAEGYLATAEDYLYTRVRTTGVVTNSYDIEGVRFEMYDVGGQRNERRKWIHCFSEVTAVIFVAALSEYDQVLFEDHTTNRIKESLDLFAEICDLKYFAKSAIILFMNKHDLFEEKIKTRPINSVELFQDYNGSSLKDAEEYFTNKFLERNQNPERNIFFHYTTATNTNNIKFVFEACRSIILEQNIKESGF